jgi:hypothetical protein
MECELVFRPESLAELRSLSKAARLAIGKRLELLQANGHDLHRPWADTLKGSKINNLKELICDADGGVFRLAYVMDPERNAVILVVGDKRGLDGRALTTFYRKLMATAGRRYAEHLRDMEEGK